MTPISHYLRCDERELHYTEWAGPPGRTNETVIAWHGFARTGRDMDDIGQHLAQRYRVICPDTIGRGLSQWSPDPAGEYTVPFYVRLATSLVDQLGLQRFHWLGTSMGGSIGILAAATTLRHRIRRLVINDIGPQPAAQALERILAYASKPPAFACVSELEAYLRTVYAPYGQLSDTQWRRMTETSARRLPDGRITTHYDPAIAMQLQTSSPEGLWPAWDSLDLPVLCLRGAYSDVLLPETAEEMRTRGPLAVVVEIPGCGHAPALNTPEQFALVERFLAADAWITATEYAAIQ